MAASFILHGAALAENYTPNFNPSQLKGPKNGETSQLLILGSMHLSQMPENYKVEQLKPINDRLEKWGPEIIAIEAVSGPQCEFMRSYPNRYKQSVEYYCWDSAPAKAATGLSVADAAAKVENILLNWPENPTAEVRRNLAALFLASGDQASALVQWLHLPEDERKIGDGLDEALVKRLNILQNRNNENYQIAAVLAVKLNLQRVYPIDDHTSDAVILDSNAYDEAISKIWDNPATAKRIEEHNEMAAHLEEPDGLLNMYRKSNSPETAMLVYESDFGAAMEDPSPKKYGRNYLGYWETRNLRMAANLRDIMGMMPSKRALVIVGASHKAYIEAYMHQMHDVEIVDTLDVLR
ncbi:hypothetical protein LPB140_10830 [Sphingorhabdus lutea]|uniref:Uncharacterized protein n=2 Tax=Sphingorhabdus lutea TaxID=1913578 RepID=A0A1L3JF81_9SPHN|nr:hypothetical protein LPB140_10830 [Sphingorhabdus lutea]